MISQQQPMSPIPLGECGGEGVGGGSQSPSAPLHEGQAGGGAKPSEIGKRCELMTPDVEGWSEWIHPLPGYLMQCCDCGLIHEMEHAIGETMSKGGPRNEGEDDDRVVLFRARRWAGIAERKVPDDVARLVVAARIVAHEDQGPEALDELDRAAEAFASRVRWDDEPEDGSHPRQPSPREGALAPSHPNPPSQKTSP